MTRRMAFMLIAVGIVAAIIAGYEIYKTQSGSKAGRAAGPPPATVSTTEAGYQTWQTRLGAIGTIRADQGVEVTTEVSGIVQEIYFQSGQEVDQGRVLVQLNAQTDIAQLHSLQAQAELARTTYERDRRQLAVRAISQAALDTSLADWKSKQAQVAQQEATIDKKTIRAPFGGRLGISQVDLGQYLNPGASIVTLQSYDKVKIDFFLPQGDVSRVAAGQSVTAAVDAYPKRIFDGKLTAVSPRVNPQTRNVQLEALFQNPGHELLAGMSAMVEVLTGKEQRYLTLPQTAVTYNPYGETVFIIESHARGPQGQPEMIARQRFITVGPSRDNKVAVLSGIKEGDTVVTAGQLKLKSGSPVKINNQVQPPNAPSPAAPPGGG